MTVAAPARPLCRRCRKRYANRPRSLCWGCYERHRCDYPSEHYERLSSERIPLRLVADPPFRCMWCAEFRCRHWLSVRTDCLAWYARASVGMPLALESELQEAAS